MPKVGNFIPGKVGKIIPGLTNLECHPISPLFQSHDLVIFTTYTGGAKCWGLNGCGQLGDGSSGWWAYSTIPVDVVGFE